MKILLCSDGHPQAERAARFLAPVAASAGAAVTLLGIIEDPADETALMAALRREAQILRDRRVEVELVTKRGHPIEEIRRTAAAANCDLVVIGAERKGRDGPFCMSAKAYKLIKMIEAPVLVVIGDHPESKRILVCSGGRGHFDRAILLLGRLLGKAGASATLLHVGPAPPPVYSELSQIETDAEQLLKSQSSLGRNLRRQKEALEAAGIQTEVRLRLGFVAEEILDELRGGDYALVVSGSAPARGRMHLYAMGDITSEIVNRADRALLIVRDDPAPGFFKRLFRHS